MGYVEADTSPKVGFRPYHQTDAEAASSLSGLGLYYRNRPFDPWELYPDAQHVDGLGDLGQNHPFKPEAWHLHGLGADPDVVVAKAVAELESAGQITQGEGDAILEGSMEFVDVLGYDPTDRSSWQSLTDLFREVNQDLQMVENAFRIAAPQHPGDPAFAQLGRDLIAKRQQYADLASQFTRYYTMVMGSAPSGLSGLGFEPITWFVAGSIAFIVIAFATLYGIRVWSKQVDVNALAAQSAQTQAQTNQALIPALARAQAAGDTVTANSILKTMATNAGGQPSATTDFSAWFQSNIKWIGLGLVGIVLLPQLTSVLGNVVSGKKRQTTKVTRETY